MYEQCFFNSNAISVPQMEYLLQVLPSHFANDGQRRKSSILRDPGAAVIVGTIQCSW